MELSNLTAISPIDGRYGSKTECLRPLFSEYALIKYRLFVEIAWIQTLAEAPAIEELSPLDKDSQSFLTALFDHFKIEDARAVKTFEKQCNHDVKSVEYFLQSKLDQHDTLKAIKSFIHFACTSEDINNLAYACILKQAKEITVQEIDKLIETLAQFAHQYADIAMLARTHGQAATPTTFGKEMAVYVARLRQQRDRLANVAIVGKCNGATGNYNAHLIAYPDVDWQQLSRHLVEKKLDLTWTTYTTQIEPHDYVAELMHALMRCNSILLDFARDIWNYIAMHYLKQKPLAGEVGSSTMPHKVNPIDFENAEGNIGIANALMAHFADKLTISRLQRDLSDSTVFRNIGMGFAYSAIAYQSLSKGIEKIEINAEKMADDLDNNWEVLAEAIQTVMRRYGIADAYEQLKSMTRGKKLTPQIFQAFIEQLPISEQDKIRLKNLTPHHYLGLATTLATDI
ncbi:MAG: adenylosuccinate lyase [Pseudomonadota bacterium]